MKTVSNLNFQEWNDKRSLLLKKIIYLWIMNFLRVFYTSIIILFVFIGNIGVNVFTHSCKEDGESHSIFVKIEHECGADKDIPSCCKKESEKKDCCSDEVSFFKVKFDFFHSYDIHIPFLAVVEKQPLIVFEAPFLKEKSITSIYPTRPPPKPSGQEILLLYQNFRI
jgi:hypothetical protein